MDAIDHLIPMVFMFKDLDEKITWVHDEIKSARVNVRTGADQTLRNFYLKTIKESYQPLHESMYKFDEKMICEETLEFLKDQKCDDDGVPSCCVQQSPGIYSFWFLKSEFNEMWMQEVAHFKKFCDYEGV